MTVTTYELVDQLHDGAAAVIRMADWLADHPEFTEGRDARCHGGTSVQIRPIDDTDYARLSLQINRAIPEGARFDEGPHTIDGALRTSVHFTDMVYVLVLAP